MKKALAAGFVLFLVIFLSACFAGSRSGANEPVNCYYLKKNFEYGTEDGVIAVEKRDASGHTQDYRYLLSMYLEGPLDPNLITPFPASTKLISVKMNDTQLEIVLSKEFAALDSTGLTLAVACLAKTGIEISSAESIRVIVSSDTFSSIDMTVSADQLLLYDFPIPEVTAAQSPKN